MRSEVMRPSRPRCMDFCLISENFLFLSQFQFTQQKPYLMYRKITLKNFNEHAYFSLLIWLTNKNKISFGLCMHQRVKKRCRLSWLANDSIVYEPKYGEEMLGLSQ
jgi:hypothetical protein